MADAFDSSTQEVEGGEGCEFEGGCSTWRVPEQPRLYRETMSQKQANKTSQFTISRYNNRKSVQTAPQEREKKISLGSHSKWLRRPWHSVRDSWPWAVAGRAVSFFSSVGTDKLPCTPVNFLLAILTQTALLKPSGSHTQEGVKLGGEKEGF